MILSGSTNPDLAQKIFEEIRKVGATGFNLSKGERSMLDAFQLNRKCRSEANTQLILYVTTTLVN